MSVTDLLYVILGLWGRFISSDLWLIAFVPFIACCVLVAIIQFIKFIITLGD